METIVDEKHVRTWATLCHASALAGFFLPAAGHILGPLIVWLAKRDTSPIIDEHGKEALNFQITMLIYSIVAAFLCLVLIGFVLLPVLHVLNVIFVIIATIQANDGRLYRYPLSLRILK
ncbi:MAG: DUF4870 domain-containing protein [Verrucomicrobiota bacterium]|nr:DUF4870 domain-containing protein [Verrucomicrobiota bacterium]